MQSLFHSYFFQALGFAIVNSIWQMSIIWIAFILLNIFFKPTAINKYRIAVTAQFIGFIWFVITLQFYYAKCTELFSSQNTIINTDTSFIIPDDGNTFQSLLLHALIKAEQFLPIISFAYLLLLMILFTKWITNYKSIQHICSKGLNKIELEWRIFVQQKAVHLGIKRNIKIYISQFISSPLTIGFIKPIILIPLASINCLTTVQMEAVLLHELAHIKRQDYLLNLILSVTETILFFNPFTQLFSKTIQCERENACDDWVLQFQYNPAVYADALLQIASLSNKISPTLSMNIVNKNKDLLLARIKRIVFQREQNFNYRNQIISLLIITAIVGCIAWMQPSSFHSNNNIPASINIHSSNKIIIEPLSAKVDNPLFNPIFFLKTPLQKEVEKNIQIVIKNSKHATQSLINNTSILISNIPVVEKELTLIDLNHIQKKITPQLKVTNRDTVASKKTIPFVFDDKFITQLSMIGKKIDKMKTDIDDEMSNNEFSETEQTKWKEEINNAIHSLEDEGSPAIKKLKKLEDDWQRKNIFLKNHQLEMQKQILKQKFTTIAATIHLTKRKLDSLNQIYTSQNFPSVNNELLPETQMHTALYGLSDDDENSIATVTVNKIDSTNKVSDNQLKADSTIEKKIEIIIFDKKGKEKKIIIQIDKE